MQNAWNRRTQKIMFGKIVKEKRHWNIHVQMRAWIGSIGLRQSSVAGCRRYENERPWNRKDWEAE